jgi:hypothetical protein
MSNDLSVGGEKQRVTETKNGLITLNATLGVEDGRTDADKAR